MAEPIKVAAREGEGLAEFVKASYPAVWRLCAAMAGEASADDLAQDTFLRAARALPSFRGDAQLRTWVLAIARRACMDELRSRYRRERRDRELAAIAAPAAAQHVGDGVATTQLLAQLDPERRMAFVLTQMIGLTYEEAASVCCCPTGTIRSRVARARGDLVALLGAGPASKRSARS